MCVYIYIYIYIYTHIFPGLPGDVPVQLQAHRPGLLLQPGLLCVMIMFSVVVMIVVIIIVSIVGITIVIIAGRNISISIMFIVTFMFLSMFIDSITPGLP